jgi:hypothetical protein
MPTLEDLTPDQLLATAKSFQSQATLLTQLTSNPETREQVQRALKKLNPSLVIPEIDAADRVLAVVKESTTRLETLENTIRERDIRDRLERARAGVQTKYKLTDEDMQGVEALMVDKDNPIPSYDAAARVFLASRQSSVPTAISLQPPTFSMPEKDTWGKGIGNKAMLDKIGLNEAFNAYNELFSGKVPGLGSARAA